jgi:N-acetylglucosaminyl-diphospho-decaprenol L-rhamnosyltransferase
MPTYSVVVVTWQSAEHLRALVDSMGRFLADDPELIVVDNASDDDPHAEAERWRGENRFLRLERNAGYGSAANVGVGLARHAAVVLLNPDAELLDSRLGTLARFALERRALAGPRLRNPDGSPQPSASGPPVGPWPWLGALLPGAVQPGPIKARTEPWRLERTVRVAWLTGACVAAPREALRRLGPFDPALEMFGEDMDLCLRAARAGIPSYFHPGACEVLHHGGASAAMRYSAGPESPIALTRRAVLRRAYGARRERGAWLAQRLNLRLRVTAKRLLGRDASRDATVLEATRNARAVRALPPPPRKFDQPVAPAPD